MPPPREEPVVTAAQEHRVAGGVASGRPGRLRPGSARGHAAGRRGTEAPAAAFDRVGAEADVTGCGHVPLQALDLSLSLVSGLTGEQIGRAVPFRLVAQGKLTGPLLHQTEKGAYYILFGLGRGRRRGLALLDGTCTQAAALCSR